MSTAQNNGAERKTATCGLVSSEPVEKRCEHTEGMVDQGHVARVVVFADRESEVVERGQRVTVFGLKAT